VALTIVERSSDGRSRSSSLPSIFSSCTVSEYSDKWNRGSVYSRHNEYDSLVKIILQHNIFPFFVEVD